MRNDQLLPAALLDRGANPNLRARDDTTPLQLAEARQDPALIDLIRRHGGHD